MNNYIEYCYLENDKPKFERSKLTELDSNECLKKYRVFSRKLEIENLFDVLIEEVKTFKSLLTMAQLSQEFSRFSEVHAYIENQKSRTKLNISYLSILNTGKLVLDRLYIKRDKFSIINDIDQSLLPELLIEREKVFKDNQYYVLCCNLRNLCQHKMLPVNRLTLKYPSKSKHGNGVTTKFQIPLVLSAMEEKEKIKLLKGLNSAFKDELLRFDLVDLNKAIDGYFEGIFDLMIKLRTLVNKSVNEAEDYFSKLLDQNIDLNMNRLLGPPALVVNNKKKFHLDFEWFRVAHYLEEKNNSHFKSNNLIRTQYLSDEP